MSDLVFGAGVQASGGLHDTNSHQANHPYSHIEEDNLPPPQQPKKYNNSIRTTPDERLAVVQRSANRHIIEGVQVGGTAPVKILGSQKGRRFVVAQCPAGAPASVLLSHNVDSLDSPTPTGWLLAAGGAPVTFQSEAAIFAISATNGTPTTLNLAQGFMVKDEM